MSILVSGKIFRGSAARLIDTLSSDDLPSGEPNNLHIQAKGPVIYIPDVQLELILPSEGVASVHLCPASEAGIDIVPPHLLG